MTTIAALRPLGALALALAMTAPAYAVTRTDSVVNGVAVDRYVWDDSKGNVRTVSLKKQGSGNPGNGGYAVEMTYRYNDDGVWRTKRVSSSSANEGFGYFVSHERYRKFTDGSSATIAGKIFGVDDSPLGRSFAVTRQLINGPTSNQKAIRFSLTYRRYGTIAANGFNANTGEDNPPLGTSPALFQRYDIPVTITWYFQNGRDFPRIVTRVSMENVPGPDRVSFDLRGPYGKLDFDGGANRIEEVIWGDRYLFKSTLSPIRRNSTWTWNVANSNARYVALIANGFEMGLLEPTKYATSFIRDGYSDGRGKTSATYFGGDGCPFQDQLLPCDYEWPYQSAQYELPYDNPNGTTTSEKLAWGSTAYYGMSLASIWDGTASTPFTGFPASKILSYSTCVVLGPTQKNGLTRSSAALGGSYKCASTF